MRAVRLLALALLLACGTPARGAPPTTALLDLPDIVAPLLPAVVNITVLQQPAGQDARGAEDIGPPRSAQGSGFVISPDGYIVTNRHVIEGAYSVSVEFNDGESFPARIASVNARPDLALLKIDAGKPLPTVAFGDSDALRIGQPVVAIGNPLGLNSSVSVGVISALNRDIDSTMIDDFIQTDAAINHGNSGGPLFNLKGEVIGVNWALLAPGQQTGSAGLGLAIPSRDAAWVIDQMRRLGRLHAGFIGVRIQQVTQDMQEALSLPSRSGGIVLSLWPGGPAAKAGLHEGDVVLKLNGEEPRDVRALLRALGASPPGSVAALLMWQNGTLRKISVPVEAWPDDAPFNPAGPQMHLDRGTRQHSADLGLRLASASRDQLAALKLTDPTGVTVEGVAANSPAADRGLTGGDIILRVQRERVASPDDVAKAVAGARAEGRKLVMLLVVSQGQPRWVVLPIADAAG
jgi:serine protease Do